MFKIAYQDQIWWFSSRPWEFHDHFQLHPIATLEHLHPVSLACFFREESHLYVRGLGLHKTKLKLLDLTGIGITDTSFLLIKKWEGNKVLIQLCFRRSFLDVALWNIWVTKERMHVGYYNRNINRFFIIKVALEMERHFLMWKDN